MNRVEARAAYLRILMDRVRQDRHPSATHMAMIEQALLAQLLPIYIELYSTRSRTTPIRASRCSGESPA
jgi:hypothetical protein